MSDVFVHLILTSNGFWLFPHIEFLLRKGHLAYLKDSQECATGGEGGSQRTRLKEFVVTLKWAGLGWLSSGMLVNC